MVESGINAFTLLCKEKNLVINKNYDCNEVTSAVWLKKSFLHVPRVQLAYYQITPIDSD